MKIGIDIDGVLTDIEQWQLDYRSKFYYENYCLGIKNYKGYETNEIFDVDIKLDDEFWNKYFRDYSINVEARKFANEVIDKLKDKIGIKKTIRDYGVEEEKFLATLDEMSEMAFDDQCTGSNPRYPLISEIKDMYLKAYYG